MTLKTFQKSVSNVKKQINELTNFFLGFYSIFFKIELNYIKTNFFINF